MKKQAKNIFNILEADKSLLIKKYPQNVSNIQIGETAVFEIETESYRSSAVKYQWQKVIQQVGGGLVYEDIPGANDRMYSFVVSSENINSSYRVVCTNGCSQVESSVNLTDGNISAPYNLSLTGPLSLEEEHIDAIVGNISASTTNYNSVHYYEIVNDDGKFYIDGNVLKSKVGLSYGELGSIINITIKATNIYDLIITKTFQISLTERTSNIFRNTIFYPYSAQSYSASSACKLNVLSIDEWVISNVVDICSVYYWPNGNFRPGPNNYQYNRGDLFIDLHASFSGPNSLGSLSQNVVLSAGKHVLYFDLSVNNEDGNTNGKELKLSVISKNSGAVVFNQILENIYVSPVVNDISVTRQRIELNAEEAGEYTVSFNSVPEMVGNNYNYGPMIGRLKLVEEIDEIQEDKKIYFTQQPVGLVNGSVVVSAVNSANTNIYYMLQRTGPDVDLDDLYVGGLIETGISGDFVLLGLTDNIEFNTYRVIAFDDNGNATISNLFMYNDLINETIETTKITWATPQSSTTSGGSTGIISDPENMLEDISVQTVVEVGANISLTNTRIPCDRSILGFNCANFNLLDDSGYTEYSTTIESTLQYIFSNETKDLLLYIGSLGDSDNLSALKFDVPFEIVCNNHYGDSCNSSVVSQELKLTQDGLGVEGNQGFGIIRFPGIHKRILVSLVNPRGNTYLRWGVDTGKMPRNMYQVLPYYYADWWPSTDPNFVGPYEREYIVPSDAVQYEVTFDPWGYPDKAIIKAYSTEDNTEIVLLDTGIKDITTTLPNPSSNGCMEIFEYCHGPSQGAYKYTVVKPNGYDRIITSTETTESEKVTGLHLSLVDTGTDTDTGTGPTAPVPPPPPPPGPPAPPPG